MRITRSQLEQMLKGRVPIDIAYAVMMNESTGDISAKRFEAHVRREYQVAVLGLKHLIMHIL